DNIDEEFTNYGQYYDFKFIPKNEFWIDKERNSGEEKYFIEAMLVINRLVSKGTSYNKARNIANRIQKRERAKSKLMRKELKIKKNKENIIKTVYKSLIKEYSLGKLKILVVNGELVRDLFFIDFTEGGHDKVYSFIPENEIWIDDDLELDERKFVILHELHERNLMSRGKDYDSAHKSSSKIEYFCRKHPKKLNKYIRREFRKAEKI
ncbi:MAG: hypothetical protein NTZ83_00245, partial [Candidatus Pacearchaeota archaeon]|nr:hypothetical protein [Candidatus Pacearchaeota archaeon]